MKILLLGASGVVGTAIQTVCKKKQIECISAAHDVIEITNPPELEEAITIYKPTIVINAVGIVGPNPCEFNPAEAFKTNAIAVRNLALMCANQNITLVQISTHAVFDGIKDDYYTELDIPKPIGVYGISKYAAELFVQSICKRYYIIRFPTLYGPRRNTKLGIVDKFIKLAKEGKELRVADDKVDSPSYNMDVAEGLVDVLIQNKPFGIYHIGNSGSVIFYDFVVKLSGLLKKDVELIRAKDSDFPPIFKPTKTAMKSIKLKPLRNWEDALNEYIMQITN